MGHARWVLVIGTSLLLTAGVWGQTRPNPNHSGPGAEGTPDGQTPRFETTSTAIVVDVVVRDGKGALITDLGSEDFDLYEDRLRQSVGSFSVANRGTGIAVAARKRDATTRVGSGTTEPEGTIPPATTESGLTALVFDRLTPENRTLAQRAAPEWHPDVRRTAGQHGRVRDRPPGEPGAALHARRVVVARRADSRRRAQRVAVPAAGPPHRRTAGTSPRPRRRS